MLSRISTQIVYSDWMVDTFGGWLRVQIERHYPSQAAFAREVGVIPQAVNNWVLNKNKPELENITEIARALGTDPYTVAKRADIELPGSRPTVRSTEDIIRELEASAAVPVPMITDLVAHMGSGGGFVDDYVYLPPDYRRGRKKTIIGIYAKGDCMMPEIRDGDAVIFDREEPWEPDDVVVATLDGHAVVRRLAEVGGRMVLRADADGETHALTDVDSIVGKVIWVMHRMVKANGKNGGNGRMG